MRKSESRGLTHAFLDEVYCVQTVERKKNKDGERKQKKTTASPLEEVGPPHSPA